jgi:hypothetical protein
MNHHPRIFISLVQKELAAERSALATGKAPRKRLP